MLPLFLNARLFDSMKDFRVKNLQVVVPTSSLQFSARRKAERGKEWEREWVKKRTDERIQRSGDWSKSQSVERQRRGHGRSQSCRPEVVPQSRSFPFCHPFRQS